MPCCASYGRSRVPPRFVDASVILHAYLKPRRTLKAHERTIKRRAQAIVTRISGGEAVVTSTVHFAEIANLLEHRLPLSEGQSIERGLCARDNVEILPTSRTDLLEALALGIDTSLGTSDALAVVLMRRTGLKEVYSFDRDFDRVEGIKRILE
jgi:predicted nucleic acid-binding protein